MADHNDPPSSLGFSDNDDLSLTSTFFDDSQSEDSAYLANPEEEELFFKFLQTSTLQFLRKISLWNILTPPNSPDRKLLLIALESVISEISYYGAHGPTIVTGSPLGLEYFFTAHARYANIPAILLLFLLNTASAYSEFADCHFDQPPTLHKTINTESPSVIQWSGPNAPRYVIVNLDSARTEFGMTWCIESFCKQNPNTDVIFFRFHTHRPRTRRFLNLTNLLAVVQNFFLWNRFSNTLQLNFYAEWQQLLRTLDIYRITAELIVPGNPKPQPVPFLQPSCRGNIRPADLFEILAHLYWAPLRLFRHQNVRIMGHVNAPILMRDGLNSDAYGSFSEFLTSISFNARGVSAVDQFSVFCSCLISDREVVLTEISTKLAAGNLPKTHVVLLSLPALLSF